MNNPEINELLRLLKIAQNDWADFQLGPNHSWYSRVLKEAWTNFYNAIVLQQNFTAIAGEYRNDVAQVMNFSGTFVKYADRYGISQSLDLRDITSIELNTYPGV